LGFLLGVTLDALLAGLQLTKIALKKNKHNN
jgi:hypothetical protein